MIGETLTAFVIGLCVLGILAGIGKALAPWVRRHEDSIQGVAILLTVIALVLLMAYAIGIVILRFAMQGAV